MEYINNENKKKNHDIVNKEVERIKKEGVDSNAFWELRKKVNWKEGS